MIDRVLHPIDPLRPAVVIVAMVAVPVRVWTLVLSTSDLYRLFPPALQLLVAVAFLVQLGAEFTGTERQRRRAAVFAFHAASAAATVLLLGRWTSGAWILWAALAGVQLWIVTVRGHRLRGGAP